MTYVFDETSRLRSDGNHVWVGLADPRQEAMVGMFGGWTAALLLRAVLSDAIDQGSPSTLTVHFIKAITPGSEVKIRTQNIGGGRSLSIWQAEVQVAGTEGVAAIAAVVLSKRRESYSFMTCSCLRPRFEKPWRSFSRQANGDNSTHIGPAADSLRSISRIPGHWFGSETAPAVRWTPFT